MSRRAFDWGHVWGLALRYVYLYKRSIPRGLEIFFWPLMDLLVWGFLTAYLTASSGAKPNLVTFLLGSVLLWDIFYRAQQGITLPFIEDIWGRSLLNVFIAPVRMPEVIAATCVVGTAKILLTAGLMTLLAFLFYRFNLFAIGLPLLPLFLNLLVTGWAMGLVTTALLLRFGQASEALVWGIPFLLQPLSAVFYPVETLPAWLQPVSLALPATHVFEGMRQVLKGGAFDPASLAWAVGLNIVYLIVAALFFARMIRKTRALGLLAKLGTQ